MTRSDTLFPYTMLFRSVELVRRWGGETPRVTVRGAQPLADIAASAALQLDCRVDLASAIEEMARILERREGARGRAIVATADPATGDTLRVTLGRDRKSVE